MKDERILFIHLTALLLVHALLQARGQYLDTGHFCWPIAMGWCQTCGWLPLPMLTVLRISSSVLRHSFTRRTVFRPFEDGHLYMRS